MKEFGWSEAFALEYAMERRYHGRSHDDAYARALVSHWVKDEDKPKVGKKPGLRRP
jgi:hypothetical protein